MKKGLLVVVLGLVVMLGEAQTWQGVNGGVGYSIYDFKVHNNRLFACGGTSLKIWDNTTWSSIYTNNLSALSLAICNDTLYIAGDASQGNGHVMRINEDSLTSSIVGGQFEPDINSWVGCKQLKTIGNKLYCSGHFKSIDGKEVNNISVWNGAYWDSVGAGLNGDYFGGVWWLGEYKNNLIAAGQFTTSGNNSSTIGLAKWDGSKWSAFDSTHTFSSYHYPGPLFTWDTLLIMGNVWDTIDNVPMLGITVWNGHNYLSSFGNHLIEEIRNFWVFDNELYAAARIFALGPFTSPNVVLKWKGFYWEQIGGDFNSNVMSIADYNNELYCGGFFTSCGGVTTKHIAKLDATTRIAELQNQPSFSFSLYPNPATTSFAIYIDESLIGSNLTITDITGREVLHSAVQIRNPQFDIRNLSSGVYFVTLENKTGRLTRKLVKQ